MKNLTIHFGLAFGILSFMSCAKGIVATEATNDASCNCTANYTPTETSLTVKNETQKMLRSRIDKISGAEMDQYTYYFVMHENKSFSVIVNIHGTQQYDFRAGTFQSNGDTLNLNYYKNLKSAYLSDKVVVDNNTKEVYFLSTEEDEVTKLKMLDHIPRSLIVMLFRKLPKDAVSTRNTAASVAASR